MQPNNVSTFSGPDRGLSAGGKLAPAQATLNGLLIGGIAGLVCAAGRRFYAAWLFGSLAWLTEYLVYWVQSIAQGVPVPDGGLGMMNAVLLAPVVGGFFALAVGAGTAAMLRLMAGCDRSSARSCCTLLPGTISRRKASNNPGYVSSCLCPRPRRHPDERRPA